MEEREITQRLRLQINKRLSQCNKASTPKICTTIQSKEGYLKIEEMIISYMIRNNMPVGASIAQLEIELE